jgi:hypothetical protein
MTRGVEVAVRSISIFDNCLSPSVPLALVVVDLDYLFYCFFI